ncbi:MAG: hypothetical protein WCX73_00775 [Candidatus Pacearchaeota archaeon]
MEDNNNKPNTHSLSSPLLLPYYLFFSNDLEFICIDYFFSVSKVSKSLDNALLEITKKKFDTLLFDRCLFEESNDYKQNVCNLILKIKNKYPKLKIGFIVNKPTTEDCDFFITLKNGKLISPENVTINSTVKINYKLREIFEYSKKEVTELCAICNTVDHKLFVEVLKQESYNFNIVDCNFNNKIITELKKIKADYFDFEFQTSTILENLLEQDFNQLLSLGLKKLNCVSNCNNFPLITENIEKLKTINQNIKLQFNIFPSNDNQKLFEIIELFDQEKIPYTIQKTEPKIQTKKDFEFFSYVSLLQALDKGNTGVKEIKERIKQEMPLLKENITFEQTLDFCINSEKKYLEFYLEIIHFLDGFFTKNEIIEYLKKLHPSTKAENIESIVSNCINLLEKEMFIDYLNSNKNNLNLKKNNSHYLSSLPRIENLFLMYSGDEKGYIFKLGFKNIEEIPKDVFFFFVFSKGIYFLKEISLKLQLLFGDKKEYSKENSLKTTEKLYQRLKQYKLCK